MEKRASASVIALVAVLLGVLGAYALGAGQRPPAAAAAEPEATASRVMMEGIGSVRGVPDQVVFDLAVRKRAADVETALDQASVTMRRVLAVLEELGVAKKDVQTTGLGIDPVYRYYNSAPPTLEGYRVTQRAEVLVRALRSAGKAISGVVQVGGDAVDISGIRLRLGGHAELVARAREAAVADAEAKAEQYVGAAGQSLGTVVSIEEVTAANRDDSARWARDYQLSKSFAEAAADRSVPIQAGSENVKVTVAVVWRID